MKLNFRLNSACFVLWLSSIISGCSDNGGGSDGTTTTTFRNIEIAIVSETDLKESSDSVEGTGSVKLVSPLAEESQAGAHIGLTFQLLQDDSEVTLVTFASSDLENGVNVKWTKTATTVSASGQSKDITSKLSGIDWSGPVSLRVDIHNNEDPTHMIMWNQSLSDKVDEANEIYNSAETEDGDFQVPGRGHGTIGMLTLKNATVTDIIVLGPQEDDH